jgi:hypothetical protein
MTTGPAATSTVETGPVAAASVAADTEVGHDAEPGIRDGTRQLRDIEELIAKLAIVSKQLAFPARTMPSPRYSDTLTPSEAQQSASDL